MFLPTLSLDGSRFEAAADGPPIQRWPDASGHVRVAAYRAIDGYWVDWPLVGRFHLTPPAATVVAEPYPGATEAELRSVFDRFVGPLYWQITGGEALHAAAVRVGDALLAFCARSGTGKSTIAYGLSRRGHAVLTDDGVLLDGTELPARVHVAARDMRLRPESARHFGLDLNGDAVTVPAVPRTDDASLSGVIVLERHTRGGPVAATRLIGAEAVTAVLAHAHSLDPTDTLVRTRSVSRYMSLLERTPVWHLEYPSGFHHLPEVLEAIEDLAEMAS